MFSSAKKSFSFLLSSSFFIVLLFSFSSHKEEEYQNVSLYQQYNQNFKEAVVALDLTAEAYKFESTPLDSLRNKVVQARLAYKQIEFYITYQFPEYATEHFNGAPLLHLERENIQSKVVAPEGLQLIDELVFAENAFEERTQIAALTKKLMSSFNVLHRSLLKNNSNFNEIAAMRLQLVRIFTLGLTGFDTPGSLNGLQETEASLAAMEQVFLQQYGKAENAETIALLFREANLFLQKNSSFETFDRFYFLKNYLDPLYKQLGTLQPEKDNILISKSMSWNPSSTSMFAADFLNPYFFTDLTKKEDSEQLKELGKLLFYDPILSNEGTLSCASCHQPDKAFTDQTARSMSSIQGKTVLRNAPTLLNAVYADRFFYDLRAFTLEQQAEHVIYNSDEFNTAYSAIIHKLEQDKNYVEKFQKVFGTKKIDRDQFSKALASYVLSLQSFNSPFDLYVRNDVEIPSEVKNGFNLFMGKASCATCHFPPTFSGLVPPFYSENETEILGVLQDPNAAIKNLDSDKGRLKNGIISEEAWIYENSFKTTTVRNSEFTGPYFHNGAYKTLEEVVDFYNNGGGAGVGLTVVNQTLSADPLGLSDVEKQELIAFMKSLSDTSAAR